MATVNLTSTVTVTTDELRTIRATETEWVGRDTHERRVLGAVVDAFPEPAAECRRCGREMWPGDAMCCPEEETR